MKNTSFEIFMQVIVYTLTIVITLLPIIWVVSAMTKGAY